ncbi:MAG: glycosyltransferase [Clostridia bacterium]|nr:glycosyltransferase [Clostridia bacterium]
MAGVKSVVFVSNYFNHHQKFLADELFKILGDGYRFIATKRMNSERMALGWQQYQPEYAMCSYESDESYQQCMEKINAADVVIVGAAPETMVRQRIQNGGLTFRYSERLLKKGPELKKFLYRYVKFHRNNPRNKPVYLLCASAYTAADYARFGLFKNRAFKWGYFTEAKKYESIEGLISKKDANEILWCGRFLKLKHLEHAVQAVAKLLKDGYPCKLKIIGSGEEEANIKAQIEELGVAQNVTFIGNVSSDKVREHMEKAGVFLFTSDFNEGWGAVLNESMNSGCAVVASHAIGAAPFLIEDGKNGLLYESVNVDHLYQKIKNLLDDKKQQAALGRAAYETIVDFWNPRFAAQRFLLLSESILNGETETFERGPCSKAELLRNNWYSAEQK